MAKRTRYLDFALIVYGIILVALFLGFFAVHDVDFFNKFAPLMTSISVALAPFVYFLKTKHNENNERTRASQNLYTELDNTLKALDEKAYPDNFKVVEFEGGKKYYFINRMLNHDFYDSLVFSGKINFLPTNIQQQTQDVFQLIKDHNSFIKRIRYIEDNVSSDIDIPAKTRRYYEALHKTEVDLLAERSIPLLKTKLKKEFKIL